MRGYDECPKVENQERNRASGRATTGVSAGGEDARSQAAAVGPPDAPGREAVEGVVDHFEELLERLGFLHVELPAAAAGSAESAIRFLVQYLATAGALQPEQVEEAIRRVLARERLGSTAIGEGVALPHATSGAVTRVVGVGARPSPGIPWGARDGAAVQRICLILAPPDRPGDYLRVLEALSQGLRQRKR